MEMHNLCNTFHKSLFCCSDRSRRIPWALLIAVRVLPVKAYGHVSTFHQGNEASTKHSIIQTTENVLDCK